MQLLIAEHAGFCEGVERAYKIALEQAKAGKPVFMLGQLVHNTQVVNKLEGLGVKTVNNIDDVPQIENGTLIISAHGVAPEVYEKVNKLGFQVVDTTCPWVTNAQKIAKKLSDDNLTVIIVGDKEHPEVRGIFGWAKGRAFVVQKPDDLDSIYPKIAKDGVGVVAQTTQSEANFDAVVEKLSKRFKNVVAHKTICGATSKRQSSAINLAKKVDVMLVIGDRKSANTKRLTELCTEAGTETHQIQTAAELDNSWLAGREKIGITAGASTPEWVIDEITALLRK